MSEPRDGYNGWRNRETWNVALWIGNDEGLYRLAKTFQGLDRPYPRLAAHLSSLRAVRGLQGRIGNTETLDGIAWNDPALDIAALDEMIADL